MVRFGTLCSSVFFERECTHRHTLYLRYSQRHFANRTLQAQTNAITSEYPHDDCWELHQAIYVPHIPISEKDADGIVSKYHERMDDVLSRPEPMFCENTHSLSGSFLLRTTTWKTIEMSSQSGCVLW